MHQFAIKQRVAGFTVALAVIATDAGGMAADGNVGNVSESTTTSTTTWISTTTLTPYWNTILLGVFPSEPLNGMILRVDVNTAILDAPACDYFGPGRGYEDRHGHIDKLYDFASSNTGPLMRSQAIMQCSFRTEAMEGPLAEEIYVLKFLNAWKTAGDGSKTPVAAQICVLAFDASGALPTASGCRQACGDAICDGGEPTALDALTVLRSAVGMAACANLLCDTDSDGAVSASDSLRVLRRAVGLPQPLLCPPPEHCLPLLPM